MTYRILVTGSRDWDDALELRLALLHACVPHLPSIVVIHGACPSGADAMAAEWASDYGVRTEEHPADWELPGKAADVCLAFIRDGSPEASGCSAAAAAGIEIRRYLRPGAT